MSRKRICITAIVPVLTSLLVGGLVTNCYGGPLHQVDFSGHVTSATPANLIGASVGDPVTGYVIYDSALITGVGPESIDLISDTGPTLRPQHAFVFNVGDVTYVGEDEFGDISNDELLCVFNDGVMTGLDLDVWDRWSFSDLLVFAGSSGFFDADQIEFIDKVEWGVSFSEPRVVPEPSSILLFAMGLGGILGMSWHRRRRTAQLH